MTAQVNYVWERYDALGNKDDVFEAARSADDIFPDGVTRSQVRAILNDAPPSEFQVRKPKILFFDIETAPLRAYIWSQWQKFIGEEAITSDWYILTWSAAWGDGEVFSDSLIHHPNWNDDISDDSAMVERLWQLLDEADVVIAHNGDKFDVKKANTRFLLAGLPPPSPYQTIDTLKILKRKFAFSSNKLKNVNNVLGIQMKSDPGGMDTWIRCLDGDIDAMRTMSKYNDGDILSLRELYYKIRHWAPSLPNMGILTRKEGACVHCGSTNIVEDGVFRTGTSEFQVYRCQEEGCGGQSRGGSTLLSPEFRANLLRPLSR